MTKKPLKLRRWLVVGVAAGALGGATAAQARPIIPLGDGGPSTTVSQTGRVAPDVFERTVPRGPAAYLGTPSLSATDSSDGFAWGDFGVGIGAAAGVMLAAVGIAWLARNRRRLATLH
jgi:hypothetical protein